MNITTPYWDDSCLRMSKSIWQPVESRSEESSSIPGTWFTASGFTNLSYEKPTVESTSKESQITTVIRSVKIRVYPTADQRQILRTWFGAARFAFNEIVSKLKDSSVKSNWMALRPPLMQSRPGWSENVPHQVMAVGIKDACQAVSAAKNKYLATKQFQQVRFRSKKNPYQNAFIPKTAVTENGVYWTRLGKLFSSEKISKPDHDCRLVLQSGRYYLIVPKKVETASGENQSGIVALDPGLRTFITAYSDRRVDKIGQSAFSRIVRLCYGLDDLTGRWEKASGASKRRMKKAANRIRNRISDLVSELHHKVAGHLTKNYRFIVVPEFNFHPMSGKLFRKTVRGLATFAHGRFRQILVSHAEKRNCKVIFQNEAYTSKTCTSCGNIQEIGSKSKWTCSECRVNHDRDINGARGIFLRALRDNSWLQKEIFATCISEVEC